ncbi:MAG: DUF4012 domain-containing protein [Candidatus Jorgensenbacteria bacterium]
MEKKVKRKNIDPILIDVRRPGFAYAGSVKRETVNLARAVQFPNGQSQQRLRQLAARVGVTFAALVLVLGGLALWGVSGAQTAVGARGAAIAQNFEGALRSFQAFDTDAAEGYLSRNEGELQALASIFQKPQGSMLFGALGAVVPAVGEGKAFLGEIIALNFDLLRISRTVSDLRKNGFRYFRSDGEKLLSSLVELRTRLRAVNAEVAVVKESTSRLKAIAPFLEQVDRVVGNSYVTYGARLYEYDQLLERLIALLGADGGRHILVFFQNPAEIRPGGGFIGSYADITIRRGQMASMDVRDIYDPDGQLTAKFTPPAPLQTMTQDWGARDGNWFFDFPTSAETVTTMMERSGMYAEHGITFEGAVAVNINVFRSLIQAVGPLPLPEYKLTITEDNFLDVIQREVEAGEDKAAGYPKRILTVLAPMVMERLERLSPEQFALLLTAIEEHFAAKDIMLYAKDETFARFLASTGVDGAVYGLPNGFWGSYLAVVNANLAGGKSDAFMEESIEARVDVGADGSTLTDLAITRSHHGDKEKDPWWRATNKNYLQIFTNPNAELLALKGQSVKNLASTFDYLGSGYQTLPQLKSIETAKKFLSKWSAWVMEEFGKTVFATWSFVPAGQTKTIEFRYQTLPQEAAVYAGNAYTFVFERQSGVKSPLRAVIAAPVGYAWVESGATRFTYENADPGKREIVKLTLAKQ